jgi:hypothetical protein
LRGRCGNPTARDRSDIYIYIYINAIKNITDTYTTGGEHMSVYRIDLLGFEASHICVHIHTYVMYVWPAIYINIYIYIYIYIYGGLYT